MSSKPLRDCCQTLDFLPHRDNCMSNELKETMDTRGKNYGEFADIADLSQALKALVFEADDKSETPMNNTQREAVEMILHKVARSAVGDATYQDNWHDIQGYAKLVEDRL